MSNKQALRELQQRLAQRMQAAREQTQVASWLAVECAGMGLLFSLKQAAEIFTPVSLKPVPYAKPWLAGVANLRGGLFTVVDLAVFLGLREPGVARGDAGAVRLVSLNPDLNINCALLVDRLVGLRGDEQLSVEPPEAGAGARPRFAGPRMRDADGQSWQQLDLEALSKHEQFLRIVV
ncbi:MAG: chemotaxis protein CheW [Burkholderiaceae bacterium]